MATQAPRQLSTWLEGIKTQYTPGISVPRLWGRGREYGIDYPLDVVPQEGTSGPDEAAAILEADVRGGTFRAPTILRGPGGEEESFNVPPPPPEPPSRAEVSKMFDEHFGNPDMFDPMVETAKRMEDLDADIRKKLDIKPGPEGLKVASPYVKKMYTTMLADEQKALYKAMVDKGKRIKAYKTEVLTNFDKQMAAAQQAREEAREERRLAIREAEERRAKGKTPSRKRVWDKQLDQYVYRTDAEIAGDPNRFGEPTREAETTKGELTEAQVRGSLQSLAKESIATDTILSFPTLWRKYVNYRKGGLSRAEAYAKVLDDIEIQVGAGDMPDPKLNKGKIIRDTITGERRKSDGKNWIPIK